MIRLWASFALLAVESHHAAWLRLLRVAAGGAPADSEARRMVSEKVVAALGAAERLAQGASPATVVAAYRRRVKANVRRLSKGDAPQQAG
jgi:hypothetical protein